MYRRTDSKGRFRHIEKAERFLSEFESVRPEHEPKFLEIWMADLGEKSGSVQSGRRPVLIVSNDKKTKYRLTSTQGSSILQIELMFVFF